MGVTDNELMTPFLLPCYIYEKRSSRVGINKAKNKARVCCVILSSPTTCSSSSVYKFIQIEIPSIPRHFSTVPEMLQHATSENWQQQQQQQQNLWFYGLPLGKNCIGPAAGGGTTDHFPVAEEDSVGVVSEDTLHKDDETGNGMKKRKTTIKVDSTGEAKKMKKPDPDEETELEAPKLENSNKNRNEKEAHSKVPEPAAQKTDYIHVRARRGQATDSHSLAERVRREKISERMKFLQDLVPGCNHITGKASVLDEIINYVQSLQKQVEFLSMKLAAVDPLIDCNIQSFMGKKINVCPSTSISREMSTELLNPSFPLFNPLQPTIPSHSELGATVNLPELGVLHKTISTPVSVSDALLSSEPCFDVCDYNMQELYKTNCSVQTPFYPLHLLQGEDNHM